MSRLLAFFSTPARQALGWTGLGLIGIAMAAGGVWFLTDPGDGGSRAALVADAESIESDGTATATPTPTRTPTPTPSASPSPSSTASPAATEGSSPVAATATRRPATNTGTGTGTGGGGAGSNDAPAAPEPTATPVPEPTAPPVVAGGDYCASSDQSSPPNSVFGLFRVGGVDVPAGSTVTLAFDGVIGPSRTTTSAGGYRVDYNAGPANCANRVGAAISVVYDGVFYPTGFAVGGGPALRADIVN